MKLDRAYAVVSLKSVDPEQRIVEGWASTPSVDRAGDIVEPMGAQFKLPLPALLFHDAENPIGSVEWIKPTAEGIPFRMRFPMAGLFAKADETHAMVREGLIRGVSVGFRAIKTEFIKATGGTRFLEWELLEISLCAIPMNQDCGITSIKSLDQPYLLAASSGRQRQVEHLQTLQELEAEFGTSTTMTPETFAARRKEIIERAAAAPAPVAAAPAPAPAAMLEDLPVTRKFFDAVLRPVVAAVGKTMKEENDALIVRIKKVESRVDKSAIALESAERRLSRQSEHLARLQTKLKALEQK